MTAAKSTSPSSAAWRGSGGGLGRGLLAQLGLELAELVLEVGERAGGVRVLEADRSRASLDLPREQQRRQVLGHVVEDALAPFLLALDRLPVLTDSPGGLGLDVAEDVRVALHELRVHGARDRLEVARAALGQQEREEVDLEEQVAELVEQLLVGARERGVRDLVGLLDRVRHDRRRRLLAVPGTVAPKALCQTLQVEQRLAQAHCVAVVVLPVVAGGA